MKLTQKFSSTHLAVAPWKVYSQCSVHIGTILDNKFENPHIEVYEHTRHTAAEVFDHSTVQGGDGLTKAPQLEDLFEEETDLLGCLQSVETRRRLNIVGDVGVGKSTFVKHIIDVHIGQPGYIGSFAIYLDWSDFTASVADPVPAIHARFVNQVQAALEKKYGLAHLHELDNEIVTRADIFANDRRAIFRYKGKARQSRINAAIERALRDSPLEFTFELINALCRENTNEIVLVVDNIDHLHTAVLDHLFQFLTEIQTRAVPLLVVAMRDHTFERGFSAYRRDRAVPAWHLRLKPPNIKLMLERRIRYFLEENVDNAKGKKNLRIGAGVLQIDRSVANTCRVLLNSPLSDPETYEFLCNYSNFNIRDLFATLQSILSCPGFSAFDQTFFMSKDPKIAIGVDECLIALGLGPHLMFFPDRSPLFNPYSAGTDTNILDKVVAVRVIQLLDNRTSPISLKDLQTRFSEWGYNTRAIEAQIVAMANKDIVWTSTGAPGDLGEESKLRLSYRGRLYAKTIMRRTIFNYMMSFDVEAPDESHAIYRHHRSEFRDELTRFAKFNNKIEAEIIADRVLGLADVVFEAERREVRDLGTKGHMSDFKADVAPNSISVGILDGLSRFLKKTLERDGESSRFVVPSSAALQRVAETKTRYETAFANTW